MSTPKNAHDQVWGYPWGEVDPKRPILPLPSVDPRTLAVRWLARYLSELTFYRPGNVGEPPIALQVPYDRIFVEPPDDDVQMQYPSMVVLGDEGEQYEAIGLGTSYLIEGTHDRYLPGTALQRQYQHHEFFTLEVHTTKKPERRALMAGIGVALNPTEAMYGLRLLMPDYYDQTVCFTLDSATRVEDDYVRGRRVARIRLEMTFDVVALVWVSTMQPVVMVQTLAPAEDDTDVPLPDVVLD